MRAAVAMGPIFRDTKRQRERQNAVKHDLDANQQLIAELDYENGPAEDDFLSDILSNIIPVDKLK